VLDDPALRGLAGGDGLVRAIHLAGRVPGIRVMRGARQVTYLHLLLERHQVIFAEGIATESLYPGPVARAGFEAPPRAELMALFPELARAPVEAAYGARARPLLPRRLLRHWRPLQRAA
jgi:hypothetical protein